MNERVGRDKPDREDMKFGQNVHLVPAEEKNKKKQSRPKMATAKSSKKKKEGEKRELNLTATGRNQWTKSIGSMRTISDTNFPMMVFKRGRKTLLPK